MNLRKYVVILAISLMSAAPFAAAEVYGEESANYTAAYESYIKAKKATNLKESSDAYAEAISYVSRAVEEKPDNFDYLVLASLIYRGKGGASYAQSYFLRAEKIINEKIKENPTDIESRINRAILCYAGDGQFSDKAYKYRKEALKEANIVVNLCHKALKQVPTSTGTRRALALAYLIKGNKRECKKQLQLASTESEANKLTLDLYEKTIGKNASNNEFLMYAILNVERRIIQ